MLSLNVQLRDSKKEKTRALRRKGLVPAILYGKGIKNICLKLDRKEFESVYQQAGESSLVNLKIPEKKKEIPVLIYDVAYDALSGEVSHIDFYHPSQHQKVKVEVPLEFIGESQVVERGEGVLVKEIQAIEVRGEPQRLPRTIKVDISLLKDFEDKILVRDLGFPEGVEIMRDPEEVVVFVSQPEQEVPEEEPEQGVESLSEEDLAGEAGEGTTEDEAKEDS